MPIIYRNPVPNQPLARPLPCQGSDCVKRRPDVEIGKAFICPNHESRHPGGCETRAFTYPRSKRADGSIHYHQGIDIGNQIGQPIVSVVDGIVVAAADKVPLDNLPSYRFNFYGQVVIVQGKADGLYYFHAHCSELLVALGDVVHEQQPIAKVGDTAYTREHPTRHLTGARPHLHFEVSRGSYARGKGEERSPEDHRDSPDLRMDPLKVLEGLGPWSTGRKFFLPTGEVASRTNLDALSDAIDRQPGGGYANASSTSILVAVTAD